MIHHKHRGFTLIELMIVIGIILLLMSVLVVSFTGVFKSSEEAQTTATIETLKTNLASFNSAWGRYPASNLNDLGSRNNFLSLQDPNATNQGNEAMVLALRSGLERGPYLDVPLFNNDELRTNLDNDRCLPDALSPEMLDIDSENSDLFEIVDRWGNPFVYINTGDLKNSSFRDIIMKGDGSTEVNDPQLCLEKLRHPITGGYPQGFVLWSFGEDGINDYGRGDDLTSWAKYEDDE